MMQGEEKMTMKKYDELYQEYPKVAKEYWEKRKVEHPTKRLLYNHLIKMIR